VELMVHDADTALAALAELHAAAVAGRTARVAIGGHLGGRPAVELSTAGVTFGAVEAGGQNPHA
jgi:hypothetical protein